MNDRTVASLREQLAQRTRALQVSEERFRNLITRNVDAIVLIDTRGMVRFVNPAAEQLFQRSADQLTGSDFGFPLLVGETTELDVLGPSGTSVVAEMRVVETEWDGEQALLAVLRDITDRKRVEEERAQRIREQAARQQAEQALHERDVFLAVASHELKTPISTLSATAQLLMRRLRREGRLQPERVQEALKRLDEQSHRLTRLVSQLLDVSRLNAASLALQLSRADLAALVRGVVETSQLNTSEHTLNLQAPEHLEAVVDPLRIEQVVTNLLDNACKYSPAGGQVDIELTARNGQARLAVRDHGIGIPPAHRARIFERFYQAHSEGHLSGMGLGLYISREVVQQHGGRIWVEFPDEDGTRFVVELPLGTDLA
jgi:signal transduction histidine kinase